MFNGHGVKDYAEKSNMKHVFYHIPKTGGQTITGCFEERLEPHVELIHLGDRGIQESKQMALVDWRKRTPKERNQAVLVAGHYVNKNTCKLFNGQESIGHWVLFREPAKHLASLYNFTFRDVKSPPSFRTWLVKQKIGGKTNWQATNFRRHFLQERFIATFNKGNVSQLKKALDEFYFVGTTETIDRDLPILASHLGIEDLKVSRRNSSAERGSLHYNLTPADRERLNCENSVDYELWGYAKERSNRFVEESNG